MVVEDVESFLYITNPYFVFLFGSLQLVNQMHHIMVNILILVLIEQSAIPFLSDLIVKHSRNNIIITFRSIIESHY